MPLAAVVTGISRWGYCCRIYSQHIVCYILAGERITEIEEVGSVLPAPWHFNRRFQRRDRPHKACATRSHTYPRPR